MKADKPDTCNLSLCVVGNLYSTKIHNSINLFTASGRKVGNSGARMMLKAQRTITRLLPTATATAETPGTSQSTGWAGEYFNIYILVFSKCFRAGYFTFSQLKFKVNKGINMIYASK